MEVPSLTYVPAATHTVPGPGGATVSYRKNGSGPPLVLVHGGFSDHVTNWEFVEPILRDRFTLYAVARRGRGRTSATTGHSLEDEARDVAAVILAIGEPVFLLGHSYGAQCSLAAAALNPASVRKLVLYEPPLPRLLSPEALLPLEHLTAAGSWDAFAFSFFRDVRFVPISDLEAVRASELWPAIVADAPASLYDLRALSHYRFEPRRFASLPMPVMLQYGTESPRHLYATDALAAILPDAYLEPLAGQAHEGMTTAPGMYAHSVTRFLLAP